MKILNQLKMEILNIVLSKFLLVIGIIIFSFSILVPLGNLIVANTVVRSPDYGGPIRPMMAYDSHYYGGDYYFDSDADPITIDGVTVEPDNPFYWQIKSNIDERDYMDVSWFTHAESVDLLYELMDTELSYYLLFAQYITTYDDYRADLGWVGQSAIYEKFIHEHAHKVDNDALKEAVMYRYGSDNDLFEEMYLDITPQQRFEALDEIEEKMTRLFRVVEENDFPSYIAVQIEHQEKSVTDNEILIDLLIKQIANNPSQEEMINEQIKYHQAEIDYINNATIPLLMYRLEKNIVPRDGSWQNNALTDIEMADGNIRWREIVTEEAFNNDPYLQMQYRTYANYRNAMQSLIDNYNEIKLIAQNSIDADMPDMKFVPQDARNLTNSFLNFSTFASMFAVIVGGWLIASEFQLGTIRLLMIRPRTRTKMLMYKFTAGLVVSLIVYIAGCLVNMLMNGLLFGFSDYGFPNFTVSGQIGFLAYYLPKMLVCIVPILFGYAVAFMFSTLFKNIAVSISMPIVLFIGCLIATYIMAFSSWGGTLAGWEWVIWTPIPYVQLANFYIPNSSVNMLRQNGIVLYEGYGIGLLAALSVIFTFISVLVFKKKDIIH